MLPDLSRLRTGARVGQPGDEPDKKSFLEELPDDLYRAVVEAAANAEEPRARIEQLCKLIDRLPKVSRPLRYRDVWRQLANSEAFAMPRASALEEGKHDDALKLVQLWCKAVATVPAAQAALQERFEIDDGLAVDWILKFAPSLNTDVTLLILFDKLVCYIPPGSELADYVYQQAPWLNWKATMTLRVNMIEVVMRRIAETNFLPSMGGEVLSWLSSQAGHVIPDIAYLHAMDALAKVDANVFMRTVATMFDYMWLPEEQGREPLRLQFVIAELLRRGEETGQPSMFAGMVASSTWGSSGLGEHYLPLAEAGATFGQRNPTKAPDDRTDEIIEALDDELGMLIARVPGTSEVYHLGSRQVRFFLARAAVLAAAPAVLTHIIRTYGATADDVQAALGAMAADCKAQIKAFFVNSGAYDDMEDWAVANHLDQFDADEADEILEYNLGLARQTLRKELARLDPPRGERRVAQALLPARAKP